ncbi:DegT/DnrJ/EryC1/StrS family aminotransferase [Sulfitobacter sabulilitoris]|uniref:DegT/DnrJ/EryC1/StrS family aminotransferase n=1 Tax=Sulfitobacter sabulilitoris TaxID=2562655 RepID=A0A5S3P7K9_9RHOB|nr:DegT/DnrJ/EryC1/StrS family aminotransferase [Sulfitobacter sabulilitoris]TMM49157.1 DegT/DnrJ/EryC1/StrS family aminotransferase [Sulfitobacter sabulilitoris]
MREYRFLDVHFTYDMLKPEMDEAYSALMTSGMYIGGTAVAEFEAEFAAYCGAAHCVGVGNGLDALILPMRAHGIGPGAEVIVPANTFIASWLAVAQTGATPVPVDADPDTMNIDLNLVEAALTDRTRAIMPVHLYGATVPCAGLRDLAEARGLLLIEDAAQAHGASDGNRMAGSLGHVAGFSFYPGKNLGAFGDGGAVVTDDADLAQAVRMLGNYGARVKYQHDVAGGNSRLDPLQAAFLSVKLRHLKDWTARRREIAAVYDDALAHVPGLRTPKLAPDTQSSWHLYVVRHPRRDALLAALAARGVQAALHYPQPNHHSGAFAQDYGKQSFPVTEEICATCLSLPIGPHLSVEDAAGIAAIVEHTVRNL